MSTAIYTRVAVENPALLRAGSRRARACGREQGLAITCEYTDRNTIPTQMREHRCVVDAVLRTQLLDRRAGEVIADQIF